MPNIFAQRRRISGLAGGHGYAKLHGNSPSRPMGINHGMRDTIPPRRQALGLTIMAPILALALAGCSGSEVVATDTNNQTRASTSAGEGLPSQHVHGVAFNSADDKVYLATHDGLFRYDSSGPVRVGPVIDLMGFTAAEPGHFYSSGHPGVGVDMPNPVGLIESTDAGQTWTALSRAGQTDFHALTASRTGVLGVDGAGVVASPDGRNWINLQPPVAVHAIAVSPDGATVVATSQSGPARSSDGGTTWMVQPEAPLLQLVHFADNQKAVGVAPDGRVYLSDNAGATWDPRGTVGAPPQAVTARPQPDGQLEILVVTATALRRSTNGGSSFTD